MTFLAVVLILAVNTLPMFAEELSPCPILDQYIEVCNSQLKTLDCDLKEQRWHHENLANLKANGFASWQEVQRLLFIVDSIEIKKHNLAKYVYFLSSLRNEIEANHDSNSFNETDSKAVRVFLPGSSRMIGWFSGTDSGDQNSKDELSQARESLRVAQEQVRLAQKQISKNSTDELWRRKTQFNLVKAEKQRDLQLAKNKYIEKLNNGTNQDEAEPQHWTHTVTADDNPEFKKLVASLAFAEARSDNQLRLIERHLFREQRRLGALEKLAIQGHSSKAEISALKNHVAQLADARNELKNNMNNLVLSSKSLGHDFSTIDSLDQPYQKVSSWPANVVADFISVQYLVEQRRNYFEETARKEIAKRQLDWMDEISRRLKQAAHAFDQKNPDQDRFTQLIKIGQQKELENYLWKRESLEEMIALSDSKLRILKMEERRFLYQSDLMNTVASPNSSETLVSIGAADLLGTILTSNLAPSVISEPTHKSIRLGYIESNLLENLGTEAELVFSQSNGYPLGLFAEHDDLLRPVKLTSFTRILNFAGRRSFKLATPASRQGLVDQYGKLQRGYQNRNYDIAAPNLYNSPFATNGYRTNQLSDSRSFDRAYPFGIIRSDLRPFARFSQPPWYFPGSPDNLRTNQLRTDAKRNVFDRTGSDLLKSKNYLDLTRPGYND